MEAPGEGRAWLFVVQISRSVGSFSHSVIAEMGVVRGEEGEEEERGRREKKKEKKDEKKTAHPWQPSQSPHVLTA